MPDSVAKWHETEIIQSAETPLHFLLVAGKRGKAWRNHGNPVTDGAGEVAVVLNTFTQ